VAGAVTAVTALALAGCAGTAAPGDDPGQPGGPEVSTAPDGEETTAGRSLFDEAPPAPENWTIHVDTPSDAMARCWDDAVVQDRTETEAGLDVTLADDATQEDADRVRVCVEAVPDHGTVVVYPPAPDKATEPSEDADTSESDEG